MFGLLSLVWGSSFLLIKIGVSDPQINAFTLVSARLGSAAVAFAITLIVLRKKVPQDAKTLLSLVAVGIINTAIPFVLITSGEQTIDSGLAGVLNGTVPLFSFVIAHVALTDDKMNTRKLFGLIAGFAGVVMLALQGSSAGHTSNPLLGQLEVLIAAVSYAFAAVLIRRNLRHVDPLMTAGGSLIVGAITVIVVTLVTGQVLPNLAALQSGTLPAILWLGLINTFVAYILYFTLIANWGASRATLVTYTMPPTSLLLGVLFEGERPGLLVLLGALLIVGGVVLANLRKPSPKAPISRIETVEPELVPEV
ncbi:MAG TPA: EamA family transporter [Aggregatilineales bacterium]|nr:EamA family transporter [Aggregatilineales bacterium]